MRTSGLWMMTEPFLKGEVSLRKTAHLDVELILGYSCLMGMLTELSSKGEVFLRRADHQLNTL